MDAERRIRECLNRVGDHADAADGTIQVLRRCWTEPHRHYHTWEHLEACMELWECFHDTWMSPWIAGLALAFHDAIYDPQRRDNEERSAELAARVLASAGLPAITIATIQYLILATDHRSRSLGSDASLVIDIDLATLGAEPDRYDTYVRAIRREYAHVDDAAWSTGRSAVLTAFLARPRIFGPGPLAGLEHQARHNLVRERDAVLRVGR